MVCLGTLYVERCVRGAGGWLGDSSGVHLADASITLVGWTARSLSLLLYGSNTTVTTLAIAAPSKACDVA